MSRREAPVTGARTWLGATLLAIAVLTGVWTLDSLLARGPWLAVSAAVVVLLSALTATLRTTTGSRLAPSAWGGAVALVLLWLMYAGAGSGPSLTPPTPDAVRGLGRLARSGVEAITEGIIPVEPTRGIELLVVTGAVLVLLTADLLALGLGRAGLAGIPLVALWVAAALFERLPATGVLLVGGTTFLLLLTLTRPRPRAQGPSAAFEWPALGIAAGVTVVALALGPLASAIPGFGSMRLPPMWGSATVDGPLRLSVDLDMRSSLAPRSDRPVLTYATDVTELGPLRLHTMVDFDGREWSRGDAGEDLRPAEGVLWPSQAPSAPDDGDPAEVRVRVGDLDQSVLPIPTDPREVEITGRWSYDPGRDEVVGQGSTTRDTDYVVRVTSRDLTAETLRQDSAGSLPTDSPDLAVPDSAFADEIRALAADVTAGSIGAYDQALALQSYFRDTSRFRYDTQVPPAETDDAVWDFLTDRRGYCVQYATAMTIMARTLDIPARMAVGFLPGRASSTVRGEFEVSGRQAHAWPELYFAGAGWVRFEPTPAVQTGAPPTYADPLYSPAEAEPTPTPTPTSETSASASPAPTADAAPGPGDQGTLGGTGLPVAGMVLIGGLVVAGLTAALVMVRRRGPADTPDPETAWADLRMRLARQQITWSDATTPRQVAVRMTEDHLGDDETAVAAVESLVSALEAHRYGPSPAPVSPEELQEWVGQVEEVAARRADVPTAQRS